MLRIAALVAGVCMAVSPLVAQAPAGFIPVYGNIVQLTGAPIVGTAALCAQSTVNGRSGASQLVLGAGQTSTQQVCVPISSSGSFIINLPDTFLAKPKGLCDALTAKDSAGHQLLGPGYGCVQPTSDPASTWCTSAGCNLNLYAPNLAPVALQQYGPVGPAGPPGPQGAPGTGTLGATRISGADLDTVTNCGFYDGHNMVNGPTELGTQYMQIQVLCSVDPTYFVQQVYDMTGARLSYMRQAVGAGVLNPQNDHGWHPLETGPPGPAGATGPRGPAGPASTYSEARISGTDLNAVSGCGFYDGNAMVNGPAALGAQYMQIVVLCTADPSYFIQQAYDMTGSGLSYMRQSVGGNFVNGSADNGWHPLASSSSVSAPAVTTSMASYDTGAGGGTGQTAPSNLQVAGNVYGFSVALQTGTFAGAGGGATVVQLTFPTPIAGYSPVCSANNQAAALAGFFAQAINYTGTSINKGNTVIFFKDLQQAQPSSLFTFSCTWKPGS